MALITLQAAQLAFGDVPLLDKTALSIETSERIGLIGRNGTGKSSLLKILAGMEHLDDGVIQFQQDLKLAYVAQEPVLTPEMTVFEAVSEGLSPLKAVLERYYAGEGDLNALQNKIEMQDGWNWEQRVTETLQRLHLDADALVGSLSGGTKKRVALGQALVTLPDMLLLDEPTNHLDLDSIQWLEDLLVEFKGSVVVITHDRAFLDKVSTRIVELDRGHLYSYQGNFQAYLLTKEAELAAEAVTQAKADKLLAQEEVWVRRGVEARRTRSVARIARLEKLRASRQARRNTMGQVKASVDAGLPSGKIVAELTDVTMSFGDKTVVNNFSATLLRGDKVGLVGPNGAGKTTLLKLILGELQASSGKVRQGANLQVAYFDQMRNALDLDATLEDFISPGSEWIEIGSQRQHVPIRRCAPSRAVSATACCWRVCSPALPMCWCWTNPPTTWTSTPWNCWKSCCKTTLAPFFWSATTAPFWTMWSPAPSPTRATAIGANMKAVCKIGCCSPTAPKCGRKKWRKSNPLQPPQKARQVLLQRHLLVQVRRRWQAMGRLRRPVMTRLQPYLQAKPRSKNSASRNSANTTACLA